MISAREWVDFYRANYREEEQARLRFFPNTRSTLEKLRSMGIKVGVVSNRRYARRPVEYMGLSPMLDVVVDWRMLSGPNRKPDPLLKVLGCLECLLWKDYVGDTDIDMMTTVAAGCRGIGMTTGNFNGKALTEAGAWHVMDDLGEIPSLFVE